MNTTLFFDIPVIPTAVSSYMARNNAGNDDIASSRSKYPQKNRDATQHCLEEFTSTERVCHIQCRNCTIQQQVDHWQDETDLLQKAIVSLETTRKKQKKGAGRHRCREEKDHEQSLELQPLELQPRRLLALHQEFGRAQGMLDDLNSVSRLDDCDKDYDGKKRFHRRIIFQISYVMHYSRDTSNQSNSAMVFHQVHHHQQKELVSPEERRAHRCQATKEVGLL